MESKDFLANQGQIFEEKFDYSQRYFKVSPIKYDIHDLTPEFRIQEEMTKQEREEIFWRTLPLTLINGSLQEGPPRLYEVPRFKAFITYADLLVSENIKCLFEKFRISRHRFQPVTLAPTNLSTDLKYYLFLMDGDSFLQQADFSALQFQRKTRKKWADKSDISLTEKGEIEAYETLGILKRDLHAEGYEYVQFEPLNYLANSEDDIFSIGYQIIVNEFVKELIEKVFPNQVKFEPMQPPNINIPQIIYDAKKHRQIDSAIDFPMKAADAKVSEEVLYFYEKAKRLAEEENIEMEIPLLEDEFTAIQKRWKVIVPESFKTKYRNNYINEEAFSFSPISDFYLEDEYANTFPETYKALIIATDIGGDLLGLILEKEDDFRLREDLYLFLHETGEVKIYN
ncbi:MAG: hypothetical protein ACKVTZ_06980 [Bacteroidia bacterium]